MRLEAYWDKNKCFFIAVTFYCGIKKIETVAEPCEVMLSDVSLILYVGNWTVIAARR